MTEVPAAARSGRQALIGLGVLLLGLLAIVGVTLSAGGGEGLRVDVLSPRRAEPGEEVPITISVRDTAGAVLGGTVDFRDGRVEELDVGPPDCATAREPSTRTFDFTHIFASRDLYNVTATVQTGGCGADAETVTARRTVQVKELNR